MNQVKIILVLKTKTQPKKIKLTFLKVQMDKIKIENMSKKQIFILKKMGI